MNSTPTVLVYDDAVETSEVLAAVYRPRGFHVERRSVAPPETGSKGTVVVLSQEASRSRARALRVVGGRADDPFGGPDRAGGAADCRMSSLFEYRELVSAIDRLLSETD